MPRIVIEKANRTLTLFEGESVLMRVAVALGKNPQGHKECEGDNRTPEGEYYICIRNSESKYYRSLGINYPCRRDGKAAYRTGRITKGELQAICRAEEQGARPPFDTPLGGAIFIHGGGNASDWTAGCIALADEDMALLFMTCPLGTGVTILP